MLKKLRRKFILIAMCSVIAVLTGIIGVINVMNYMDVNARADEILSVLAAFGGRFPSDGKPDGMGWTHGLSPEAPFKTRYFSVVLTGSGEVVQVDVGQIAAVSAEDATAYAFAAAKNGGTDGFADSYKYLAVAADGENTMYIFLDCSEDLSTFYTFLATSAGVSAAGVLLVFILVLIFSGWAFKPIAENQKKQKQFITDAGHELKTPLTIIDADTEILEMENGENEWTRSIRNQVERLSSLTEKLIMLSRADEGNIGLTMTDFSLSDAVQETAQTFEPIAVAQNKRLDIQTEKNLTCCGDEKALRQVVSVLLDNAMKYSSDGGTIAVRLDGAGKRKELTVSNPADGVAKGSLDMFFERFYRSDESRNSRTGGHGIGLAVAKAIVEAHKGKISAFSPDGRQVVFTVSLE